MALNDSSDPAEQARAIRASLASTLQVIVDHDSGYLIGGSAYGAIEELAGAIRRAIADIETATSTILAPALPLDHLDAVPDDRLYGFDHFWKAWPPRGGKRLYRARAQQIWAALTLRQRKAAWRGAVNYSAACAAGTQGAIDAFRWLRDRSWEDWQSPATSGPTVGRPTAAASIAAAAERVRTGQSALFMPGAAPTTAAGRLAR